MSCFTRPSVLVAASFLLLTIIAGHGASSAGQLTLSWQENSTDVLGFSIERAKATGAFAEIARTGRGVTTYTDATVDNATTYCYRVRAFDATAYSDYSLVVCGNPAGIALAAAVLPSSRSLQVGNPATALVAIINGGSATAHDVGISLQTPIPATFSYQPTDPVTNQPMGPADTPVSIPPQHVQTYVIVITPVAAFAPTDVVLNFVGNDTAPVPVLIGVNTLLLSASVTQVPDIVVVAATLNEDGIVNLSETSGTGVFSVATVNLGAGGSITASADTGGVALPLTISPCQTNPATGQCISAVGPTVTTQINANDTPTFGVFVAGTATVPFDPANNRVFVRFKDAGGVTRGATSVAVRTQ